MSGEVALDTSVAVRFLNGDGAIAQKGAIAINESAYPLLGTSSTVSGRVN